jgi:hypothetical protein
MYIKTVLLFDHNGSYIVVRDVETYSDIKLIRDLPADINSKEFIEFLESDLGAKYMFTERGGEKYFVRKRHAVS